MNHGARFSFKVLILSLLPFEISADSPVCDSEYADLSAYI